jgi:hypothetical protein
MKSSVSNFKAGHKVLSIEPLHVNLAEAPGEKKAISIPVEDLTIGQTFSPSYTPEHVYGRMDPIVTYKNTTRKMTFKFKCQAHHVFDKPSGVVNNIRNVNLLTQLLYPVYHSTGRTDPNGDPYAILGAPPFFRIKYGNYVGSFLPTGDFTPSEDIGATGITGYITAFVHTIGAVAKNVAFGKSGNDKAFRALPREISVSFGFDVIHDKLVGWYNGKFSPNGYGYNFPYNVGKFGTEDKAAMPAAPDMSKPSNAQKPAGKIPAAKSEKVLKSPSMTGGWKPTIDYF